MKSHEVELQGAPSEGSGNAVQGMCAADQTSVRAIQDRVACSAHWVEPLRQQIGRVLVGQEKLVDSLLVSVLADGHVLLEGVPGLAKTLTLKTLADAVHGDFRRIQFTPDMLPADIVGTEIYNPRDHSFETKRGPVFANLVLADEINRAPAKVQSALLEAMQERQVTIGETTERLPDPFLVMATQNPLEQDGTYPLPEAQVDRFLLKVVVDYPDSGEERRILDIADGATGEGFDVRVEPVVTLDDLRRTREVVRDIHVDGRVKDYMVALVDATRNPGRHGLSLDPYIRHGASPRATLGLLAAGKARAFLAGRGYVTPQDVKGAAMEVLRHRIGMTFEADAEGLTGDHMVERMLDAVHVA